MKKINGIPFVAISIIIQLVSIPLLNEVLYGIAALFHKQYIPTSSSDGMDFYFLTIRFLAGAVIVFVLLTTIIQEFLPKEWVITILHLSWLVLIIKNTLGDLSYRPYEHGLLLFCIALTFPIRILLRRFLHT